MFSKGKTNPVASTFNHEEITCASCGAHQLQSCGCTWEEIDRVEKSREERRKNVKVVTVSFSELMKRIERKKNEK